MPVKNTHTSWFSEYCPESGSTFSLETTAKLHQEQSPYQTIEIFESRCFGNLLVIDGFIMLSSRDNFIYHEMITHPALFSHPSPQHVVIVGGGDCGALQQVARHQGVQTICQIEIDERVTRLCEQYFPELCTSNHDRRVNFQFTDAIEWMRAAGSNSIDVIIIDSTDPVGPAEGLFQKAFYADCFAALKADGLLIQQSESPLIHWQTITQPMQNEMRAAAFNHLKTIFFPQPVYPTGWWSATLAAKNQITFGREDESKNLNFKTEYYNHAIHTGAFAVPAFLGKL